MVYGDGDGELFNRFTISVAGNGGVHINSGIPNRAFYLAATGIGGYAADAAGRIWYEMLLSDTLAPNAQFDGFAQLTVQTARLLHGAASSEAEAVLDAWNTVGVRVLTGPAGADPAGIER
jgi:Zn-dependent metalloprotease